MKSVSSALWVYLRIQLGVFVVGIVGPIFFFAYFASQPDPTLRWMFWWGLVITFVDIFIALSLTDQALRTREEEQVKRQKVRDDPDRRYGD